mgnify:CR=1 FL=1
MKKLLVTTLLAAAVTGGQAQVKHQSHGYPIDPVPFTSVKVTDSFWGQRLKASREVTIPLAFSKCEETGRYRNFINAAWHRILLLPSKWKMVISSKQNFIRRSLRTP